MSTPRMPMLDKQENVKKTHSFDDAEYGRFKIVKWTTVRYFIYCI
jgi:hypothetical protein